MAGCQGHEARTQPRCGGKEARPIFPIFRRACCPAISSLPLWLLAERSIYQSEVRGGRLEARGTRIPGYVRLDLMGEYRFTKNVTARLNVLNVADKTYHDTLYASSAPFVYVAPGREALLTLSVKF